MKSLHKLIKKLLLRKIILSFIFLFPYFMLNAQYSPEWVSASADYQRYGSMAAVDSANNLIVVGYRPSFVGAGNIYTRKYDETGALLWEQIDMPGVQGKYEMARWVNTDFNNNIYVTGFKYSGTSNIYTDTIIVLKYSPAGVLEWKKNINHVWPGQLPMRSAVDDTGNLYIGTVGVGLGFVLIKFDSAGNIIYNASNASSNNISFASMRIKDSLVVMTSYAGNGGYVSVCAFDTSGNYLWSQLFQSWGGMDVEIDDSLNSYILTRDLNLVSPTSNFDFTIFKFNQSGVLMNQFNYDFNGGIDFAGRMTLVNSKISVIGQNIQPGFAYMDWIVFQIDLSGNKLWDARYDLTTTNDEKPSWISAKSNGDVYVSGQGGPDTVSATGSHYLRYVTAKYRNGNLQWVDANPYQGYVGIANVLDKNCGIYALGETAITAIHYSDSCDVVSSISDLSLNSFEKNLNVFPNPASNHLSITFNLKQSEIAQISVLEMTGKLVLNTEPRRFPNGDNEFNLSLQNLHKGIYVVEVKAGFNTSKIKILIQ